ncbi:COG1470 family protein [Ferruginibacter sp.]
MSEEKSAVAKDIEELVNKTIEANKFFMSEGTNILKHFTNQNTNNKSANFIQPDTITNVFNAYLKLNLQHAKNLIDLGVGLVKQSVTPANDSAAANETTAVAEPAFILKADVFAGDKAQLQFVLDNVKDEVVLCKLVNSEYKAENKKGEQKKISTSFDPQSFELKPGGAQTVKIVVTTDKNCEPGNYTSNAQVQGFEPAFFSIALTIKEKQQQQKVNGRKKQK